MTGPLIEWQIRVRPRDAESETDEAACYCFLARGEFAIALGCGLLKAFR